MKNLIILLGVSLSFTSVSFFKIGMAEFTIFHAMAILVVCLLSFIALARKKLKFSKPPLFFATLIYLTAVNLSYYDHIKVSSFIYSLVILFELLILYNCVKWLDLTAIKKITKTIILLYLINLVVATVFIKINFYPKGFIGEIFRIYIFDNRIRPYGFSDEPSYASLILIFCLYTLFKCDNFQYRDKEFRWYLFAIVSILLTGSSYGVMLLAILLVYFIIKSNVILIQAHKVVTSKLLSKAQLLILPSLAVFGLFVLLNRMDFANNTSVKRIVALLNSVTSSDGEVTSTIKQTVHVDGSASMRLVPTVLLADDFSRSETAFVLFGRGAGQSVPFFSKLHEGNVTILGFIPSFIYNYGLLGAGLFFCFFIMLFPKKKALLVTLFVFFIFNADFNTQIFLFVLFTAMLARQAEQIPQDTEIAAK